MKINRLFQQFLLVSVLVLGLQAATQAQSPTPYGNEWIDYNKTYYKLKVVNTGLHRLSHGFLDSLGLADTNPQHFQLFRRGKEVAIHIAGEADGRLDREDFIEFYGERNDGRLDQDLYKNPAHQPHQLYSLYTDTAAYFLTVNPAGGKRMQQVNPSPVGKTPEPYHLQKVTRFFTQAYNSGKYHGDALLSWMDEGEGYVSSARHVSTDYDINSIVNVADSGPKPQLEYTINTVSSSSPITHKGKINLVLPAGGVRTLLEFSKTGAGYIKGQTILEFSEIYSQNKITLRAVPDPLPPHQSGDEDKRNLIAFSYATVTFPQRTIYNGSSMFYYTDSSRVNDPYFEFANNNTSLVSLDVTNPNDIIKIEGYTIGQSKGFVINTQGKSRKILLANSSSPLKPRGKVDKVTFRQISPDAHNYIVLTNKRLMKPVSGSMRSGPIEYTSYRASVQGGGYDTLLVHMDQIVDQFHYGEYSSNAVRKFMAYMMISSRQKHLFIIGKGMKYASSDFRNVDKSSRASLYHVGLRYSKAFEVDLVPTGMFPSSDVFFTADFRNNKHEPRVPTGRLPVTKPEAIIDYLNKVKEYEALPEGLAWRKNILHLGGGSTDPQIRQLKGWLDDYKSIAEGPFLGANIIGKYRQGVSAVQDLVNVSTEVNAGLSMITFFGHSSASTSDLEIGFVSQNVYGYRNKGKYPVILMNGCGTGDAFIYNFKSFGEDWLLTPDRGAISFIAHAHTGGDRPLYEYSLHYHQVAFKDEKFYGGTIGEIQQEAVKRYSATGSSNLQYVATMTQMVLQSDPAIRPYAPSKPDYAFNNPTYSLKDNKGDNAISYSNPLVLKVNAVNYGKAILDSINVSVKRTIPNGAALEPHVIKVKPIYNSDQLELILPNTDTTASGMNRFEIKLDATDQIAELNESNNLLQVQHFLPKSGISILAPNNYAIVNSNNVNLIVQSTQMRAEPKGVYFELDTTTTFSSTLKKSHTAAAGVIPSWEVTLPIQQNTGDSTVFYWRARFESYAKGEDTVWVESSFRYIPETNGGWSQSHQGQFKESEFGGARIGKESGNWEFDPLYANIEIRTVGGDVRYGQPPFGIFINGTVASHNACGNFEASSAPRMYFFMLDKETLERTVVPGFKGCSWIPDMYQFGDLNNPTVRANMQRFLEGIPEGNYVLAISMNRVPFEIFSPELKSAFGSIGSILIPNNDVKNGYPFAIIGKKGATTALEATANPNDTNILPTSQEIFIRTTLQSKLQEGFVTSTTIGPAISWKSLHHNIEKYKAGNDSYKLSLFGINAQGQRELLNDNITTKSFDLSNLSADQYPNLQLSATLTDTEDRTAPQLRQWMVYYEAAPEGVIRPDLVEVSEELIVQQANRGRIEMPMAFQNVTPYAFRDSITVEVTLTGDGVEPRVSRFKIEALEGNKTATFNYTMSTSDLDGNYRLLMYVNPQLQPEQQYQNNIYEINFGVKSKLHPIMDVAFDGVHIMDGELVAPSPLISITMKDENKHVYLENADAMEVYLEGPNIQGQYDVIKEAKPSELRISPADEKNDFRFEYKPERLENGIYTLTVNGKDATGKFSGASSYKINFEVENESKITNFYPYPNPFSSKTQFIFTLTGGVIPDQFKIQIMTVTGKIVKEIMREEIGPIRIGNNKTEYAWDGTDTYGDKLANGVYLYRVVMPKDIEEMKHIWKKGDKGFVNGYGKIYILR
ncbi:putative type IX secretion system sortase PorU2 [Pontibacter virosus]|uniref:Peptidase C25-like protein n=1 Tax=Pontibacter virosus TaxID=1765052 RepID=A0A2U1AXH6_9BACT|nr:C25 family cysteine peptidase [Pontibacter virosus]PVY41120.1 peptidase C25-like protein [Pontibacter virosus]